MQNPLSNLLLINIKSFVITIMYYFYLVSLFLLYMYKVAYFIEMPLFFIKQSKFCQYKLSNTLCSKRLHWVSECNFHSRKLCLENTNKIIFSILVKYLNLSIMLVYKNCKINASGLKRWIVKTQFINFFEFAYCQYYILIFSYNLD